MKDDTISRQAAIDALNGLTEIYLNNLPPTIDRADAVDVIKALPSAQPMEDARAMCGECDAWNKYKNYPQPEQFNPCTVCQEFDCTGCKFRRV